MSNIQKPSYHSNGVELSHVVINPSIYTNQHICWEADFSSQYPVSSIIHQDGAAVLNVGSPHEGYTIETHVKDNKMYGKSSLFSKDNILVAELNFEAGIANGSCTLFDSAGNLFFDGYFSNGYRSGIGKEFDNAGNIIYDGCFKNGKRYMNLVRLDEMEGYWKEYNENGTLLNISQINIETGEKEGICYYYENGKISHIVEVYEGTEIEYCGYLELYDEPNKVWFEGYYDNGKKLRIEKMNDRKGYQKEFDEEDQLIYICKRDGNGKLNGICYRYMNGGKITRISKWKDGKEVALIKLFNGHQMTEYKKGVKQYEGEFLDCLSYDYVRHGVGKEFDKDGKTVIYQGGYENGKRHGSGITYKDRKKDYDGLWINGKMKWQYMCIQLVYILLCVLLLLCLIIGLFYLSIPAGIFVSSVLVIGSITYCIWIVCEVQSFFGYKMAKILYKPNIRFKKGLDFNNCDKLSFSKYVKSIDIPDCCFESVKELELSGLVELKTLNIGINSFSQKKYNRKNGESKSFHVLNCGSLESIHIGEKSIHGFAGEFELKNLPKLQSIEIGSIKSKSNNFRGCSFVIRGTLYDIEYDMMIRPSKSTIYNTG